jgi:hypothetical protein
MNDKQFGARNMVIVPPTACGAFHSIALAA